MLKLEICARTDSGIERSINEDDLLTAKYGDVYLLAVADGLGGHVGGEVASRMAIVAIDELIRSKMGNGNIQDTIQAAMNKANKKICQFSKENPAYTGMGTTLIMAAVTQNRALIANIGDSRAYLIGNDSIKQITKDHSLVQELVDKSVITKTEAFNHPQRNIVTRILGKGTEVTPDYYEEDLSGKLLLLCSDGLSDMLQSHEILNTIIASTNLDEACTNLINMANERGGKDNISVILAREAI